MKKLHNEFAKITDKLWETPPFSWPSSKPINKKMSIEMAAASDIKETAASGRSVKSPILSLFTANR
jgi:hypothetical protein